MTKAEALLIGLTFILLLVEVLLVPRTRDKKGRLHRGVVIGLSCIVAVATITFIARPSRAADGSFRFFHDPITDSTIKSVARSAALTEMLGLYEHPEAYDSVTLGAAAATWWVAERDSGAAISPIRDAVARLRLRRVRYGTAKDADSSRNVLWIPFFLQVYAPGDSATLIALEEWHVPLYSWEGQRLHPPKHQDDLGGRYAAVYGLRKDQRTGRWLIRSNSSPYLQY